MSKNKRIFVSFNVVLLLVLSSCGVQTVSGSGVIISESRAVRGFTRIEFKGMGRVILTQGDEESLNIEADDNLVQYISTNVRGQYLQIKFDRSRNLEPTEPIIFRINVKDLNAINFSGAASFQSERLAIEQLEITLNGAGTVDVDWLIATEVKIVSNGDGNIVLAGNVERQEVELNGSGNYTTPNLQSQVTNIVIEGAGNAVVWVQDSLDVEINGNGDVSYFGSPEVSYEDNGFGDLKSLGEK